MTVTLAPAGPADLEALLPLVRDYHAFEGIELADAARTQGVRGLLQPDAPGGMWFIVDAEQRVGYAAVCCGYSIEFGGRDGFLDELYVVPEARGRGIGTHALAQVVDAAAALGIRALHLEVARTNARARALYATLGFESREAFQLMTRQLKTASTRTGRIIMQLNRTWIDRWIDAINTDAACANMGRGFDGSFTLALGADRYSLHVRDGRVTSVVENGGPLEPSTFTLSAAPDVWQKLFDPNPPAMYQAIFAAVAAGTMQFEGDVRLLFQQMTTLSRWITVGRALQGETDTMPDPAWPESFQAVGRYVNVPLDGAQHKVFYFEAGQGVPVLLQHTAGNENRQWRHLLEDRELTQRYRFIAYDLPSHGKSDPPYGRDFFAEDHLLTSDWITRFVAGLADALDLDRPIFLGCSIGGVIACHLAARLPDRFRGLIGLAGAVPTHGFFHDWWIDPAVNQRMMQAGMVDAVMAPGISHWDRQINRMAQGAHPKAMRNDLYFWGEENADEALAAAIDPTRVPLYLYAGEYDFTCPPAHVEASVKRMAPGVHYEMIAGVGHFPMSEDYVKFRPVLTRTLDAIEQRHRDKSRAA